MTVALTIGDAAGVGPELILRFWPEIRREGPAVVVGSAAVLAAAQRSLVAQGLPLAQLDIAAVAEPTAAQASDAHVVPVLDVALAESVALDPYPWGSAVPAFGALQYAALVRGVGLAQAGAVDGLVTLPWHKARLADAGLPPTGHTEVLEQLAACGPVVMMLASRTLRVALVTAHLPLRAVPDAVTGAAVRSMAEVTLRALRHDFAIEAPRLAVCGLNPHAGEAGTMGREEQEVIIPALEALRAAGHDVTGPHPADTLFPRVVAGDERCDAVLAMYHDQGLVGLKTASFGGAVNVTLGLNIVRTSVDHGTAYDIAGRGVAKGTSLLEAVWLARDLAARRRGGV